MGDARWYVCETKWRAEHATRDRLRRQGFHTLLPTFVKTREIRRERVEVEVPLFIRYLFVKFDLAATRWRSVAGTRGVLRLLGYRAADEDAPEQYPTPLPVKVADKLLLKCGPGPLREEPDAGSLLLGSDARVLSGPFAGMVGRVDGVTTGNGARVSLLLHLLGRPTCVRVQPELVAAA